MHVKGRAMHVLSLEKNRWTTNGPWGFKTISCASCKQPHNYDSVAKNVAYQILLTLTEFSSDRASIPLKISTTRKNIHVHM